MLCIVFGALTEHLAVFNVRINWDLLGLEHNIPLCLEIHRFYSLILDFASLAMLRPHQKCFPKTMTTKASRYLQRPKLYLFYLKFCANCDELWSQVQIISSSSCWEWLNWKLFHPRLRAKIAIPEMLIKNWDAFLSGLVPWKYKVICD